MEMDKEYMTIGQLAKKMKIPIYEITPTLTMMEIDGYIQALPGQEFILKRNT